MGKLCHVHIYQMRPGLTMLGEAVNFSATLEIMKDISAFMINSTEINIYVLKISPTQKSKVTKPKKT